MIANISIIAFRIRIKRSPLLEGLPGSVQTVSARKGNRRVHLTP